MSYDPVALGARCAECPLRGKKVVPSRGAGPVAIVGDAPSKVDEQQGEPFVGPAGFRLNDMLRRAGLPPRAEMLLTNAILCRPEVPDVQGRGRYDVKGYLAWLRKENVQRKAEGHPPVPSPFECCWPRLKAELRQSEAQAQALHQQHPSNFPSGAVVFPVGNFALSQTMSLDTKERPKGVPVSTLKYRGSVIPVSLPPLPVQEEP